MAYRYKYQAVDRGGLVQKGVIEAEDQATAIIKLKSKYEVIKDIKQVGGNTESIMNMDIGGHITNDQLALLCSQFAVILKSGAPIAVSTRLLAKQAKNKRLKKILIGVHKDVTSGKSLANSFERNGKGDLPVTFYETIRAGDESGKVTESFETLARYFEKNAETGHKVKGALIYPVFVILIAIAVIIVVMSFVVPKLVDTFDELGADMPGITKALIAMSNFFERYWILIIIGIVVVAVGIIMLKRTKDGKRVFDKISLKIPLFGPVVVANACNNFTSTLGMLTHAGLPMTKALYVVGKTMRNSIYEDATYDVAKGVETGRSINSNMRKHACYPETLTEMVTIGEDTGEMEEILSTMSEYYQKESDRKVKNLLAAMEPALLIVIAAFAAFIVFSIYIPLFKMYENM